MKTIGIIPARLASTRFPNKPLALLKNIPMIGHVFLRSKMSKMLEEVFVATCDQEIAGYIHGLGGRAIMTDAGHERASDRTAEAVSIIEKESCQAVDIVVMIQGDEPMVFPEMIDAAVKPLLIDRGIDVVNLMTELKTKEEHEDPNEVKVVVDRHGFALYFSREPIPSRKKGAKIVPMLKQVCIIPFRRNFLSTFNQLEQTPLEIVESVDMNRVLEHGYKVKMVKTDFETYSVDTEEDLQRVERLMESDPLVALYLKSDKGTEKPNIPNAVYHA